MQRVGIWTKPSGISPIWVTLLRGEEECTLESCALPLLTGSDPSWPRVTCWTKSLLRYPQTIACPRMSQESGSLSLRVILALGPRGAQDPSVCAHSIEHGTEGGAQITTQSNIHCPSTAGSWRCRSTERQTGHLRQEANSSRAHQQHQLNNQPCISLHTSSVCDCLQVLKNYPYA